LRRAAQELKSNPRNYDVWFDYVRLEETNGDQARIRETYERAIANIPLEKVHTQPFFSPLQS
jgi:crooked neck